MSLQCYYFYSRYKYFFSHIKKHEIIVGLESNKLFSERAFLSAILKSIFIIFGLGICALLFYLFRKYGIDLLIKRGKDPKLVDQESFDDSFNPTSNNHP